MVEKTGDSSGIPKFPEHKVHGHKPSDEFVKEFKDQGSGKMHRFGSMEFTESQWKEFINNFVKMIVNDIKRQEKRMKKAMRRMKESIEGKPLD